MNLNITKASKIYHFSGSVLKPKKHTGEIERCKDLIEKNVSLAEFKRKFGELRKDQDITFHAYILKIISSKNPFTGELEVLKVLAMT